MEQWGQLLINLHHQKEGLEVLEVDLDLETDPLEQDQLLRLMALLQRKVLLEVLVDRLTRQDTQLVVVVELEALEALEDQIQLMDLEV